MKNKKKKNLPSLRTVHVSPKETLGNWTSNLGAIHAMSRQGLEVSGVNLWAGLEMLQSKSSTSKQSEEHVLDYNKSFIKEEKTKNPHAPFVVNL